jgi:hypothetical protein
MSGLFDLNTERGKEEMREATAVLLKWHIEHSLSWGQMLDDARREREKKTCISCGSPTQPCCGH